MAYSVAGIASVESRLPSENAFRDSTGLPESIRYASSESVRQSGYPCLRRRPLRQAHEVRAVRVGGRVVRTFHLLARRVRSARRNSLPGFHRCNVCRTAGTSSHAVNETRSQVGFTRETASYDRDCRSLNCG